MTQGARLQRENSRGGPGPRKGFYLKGEMLGFSVDGGARMDSGGMDRGPHNPTWPAPTLPARVTPLHEEGSKSHGESSEGI